MFIAFLLVLFLSISPSYSLTPWWLYFFYFFLSFFFSFVFLSLSDGPAKMQFSVFLFNRQSFYS